MNAVGLIFADSYDVNMDELTEKRTLAAVSFGGRYRVIDFTLSNMVNAGIHDIGIILTQKYSSLMRHVRAGSEWDLDRKQSSLRFLPPFATEKVGNVFANRLEALQANLDYLKEVKEKYVLFSSSNYVANIDFEKMLKFHEKSAAKCTALITRHPIHKERDTPITSYDINDEGQIRDVDLACEISEADNMGISTFIMDREDLIDVLGKTAREGKMSFRRDVLADLIKTDKVMAYEAEESVLFLDDISCYLKSNMELLNQSVRDELFQNQKRPIITRVKDSAPARYGKNAKAVNSIIADGAIIDGEVRNSIIFRGVRVKKGAVVENSVIMQDTTVGEGAHINYAVMDKDVIIQDSRLLSGYITHPFYVGKGIVI